VAETGIVTPEAVVLAFETAGLGSRLAAELVDLLIQAVLVTLLVAGSALSLHSRLGGAPVYVSLFVGVLVYPVALETLWRGRSVGKAVMGLRVVTTEGGQIRFRHAAIRGALALVDFWGTGGAAAVLSVLATKRNQRLGDLAAGTLVLRERSGAPAPSAATFAVPPGWEGYAATLDVSAVSATDYGAVRSFLLRAATLDPWTRERLAREIATPLLVRLRHQPPPGVPAELLLACVAALYQQRQRRWQPAAASAAPRPAPPPAAPPRVPAPSDAPPPATGFVPPP
jgi:uncharacterized RDD family membrane protein YckC